MKEKNPNECFLKSLQYIFSIYLNKEWLILAGGEERALTI